MSIVVQNSYKLGGGRAIEIGREKCFHWTHFHYDADKVVTLAEDLIRLYGTSDHMNCA